MRTLLKGIIIGGAATQALDLVSERIYRGEGRWLRFRENAARGFLHAYERAVSNMASAAGVSLTRRQRQRYGWAFHKLFGAVGGLGYAALRQRYPRIGTGRGALFGVAFFALADELLMPVLGLTPGPTRFSWKVHARGAAAHVAYGVAAELAARVLDRFAPRLPARAERARSARSIRRDEDLLPDWTSRTTGAAPAFYAP